MPFRRGDVDASGGLDISDPIAILAHLFLGATSSCRKAADLDDSGELDMTDPIVLLRFLFLGEGPIAAPGPACGLDPTEDGLGCERSGCK